MRIPRRHVLGIALFCGITLGAPVALWNVDAPVATAALSRVVDDAAAQAAVETPTPTSGGGGTRTPNFHGPRTGNNGGDADSSDGDGASGGTGNGGLASLHDLFTTSAASDTSQILSDIPTGDIHHDITIVIEDTDETVVINNAGSPGSTGVHAMNVGAPTQLINTGGNNNSADASGSGGDGGINSDGDLPIDDGRHDAGRGDGGAVTGVPTQRSRRVAREIEEAR
jgi:hypothetical protein